jgi:hypothetical protein
VGEGKRRGSFLTDIDRSREGVVKAGGWSARTRRSDGRYSYKGTARTGLTAVIYRRGH